MLRFDFLICDFTSHFLPSSLPLFHPPPVQYISLFPSPLYIHYRPDYANMGSFMSSVLRIFSSPWVCKEARYHHRPIVEHSLQSAANPAPLSPQSLSLNVALLSLTAVGLIQEKHQAGRWDNIQVGITVPVKNLIF